MMFFKEIYGEMAELKQKQNPLTKFLLIMEKITTIPGNRIMEDILWGKILLI